jgi:hypothetical protein
MASEVPLYLFSAALRIMNVARLHEEIEAAMGIEPSTCHVKGELRNPQAKIMKTWNSDIWILKSPLPGEEDLSAHLRWLWEKIFRHREYLKMLSTRGAKIDVFCGYRSTSSTSGFSIRADALSLAYELGVPLEISVILF